MRPFLFIMTLKQNTPHYQQLEVVNNEYPNNTFEINISIPEFNAVCPKTGLPDFGTIYINYIPNKLIIELKSLKLYIVAYRNFGIFHEHVTNKILEDFIRACKPKTIEVTGDFNPRGGIKTIVKAKK